ncbi:hypothetical protein F66182_7728 [Fusarium sp. NRRL 66182]|nr:hypothetical protein F66182_7728 [Fusarium sp. NRRL 66182]
MSSMNVTPTTNSHKNTYKPTYRRVTSSEVQERKKNSAHWVVVLSEASTNVIGKGYAYSCAARLATCLDTQNLQIWAEVGGFLTADPRRVPSARLIRLITAAKAIQLTPHVSGAMQPSIIEQAMRAQIHICVENLGVSHGGGIVILPEVMGKLPDLGIPSMPMSHYGSHTQKQLPRDTRLKTRVERPTAITVKDDAFLLNIHSNRSTRVHGFLLNVFRIFHKWHFPMDLVSSSEAHVAAAFSTPATSFYVEKLKSLVAELGEFGKVDVLPNMTIIGLIHRHIKTMAEVSGQLFRILGDHGVNIEMISQGASQVAVSCVIRKYWINGFGFGFDSNRPEAAS